MRIDTGSYLFQNMQAVAPKEAPPGSVASGAPVSGAATNAPSSGVARADFTSMTRQQLFDWMNNQIRSGAMSLDDSTPFLGMTLKVDARTGVPVDMASDATPVDFVDRARQGIAGAIWRGDQDGAQRLQPALATMQRYQGQVTGVDIRA